MTAAIINVCLDPRLDHGTIRAQVRDRLGRLRLQAQRIYVTADVGGNVGSGVGNTLELLRREREATVLAAVLHHDDCAGARSGLRKPLDASAGELAALLDRFNVHCPVLKGSLRTEDSYVWWADERPPSFEVLTFRMPRMFG